MSYSVDIKPVLQSIRVKKEPVEHRDEVKPRKPTIQDMVRRRSAVLKKRGKRKRRKRKRKKTKRSTSTSTKTVGKIKRAISGARRALVYNLGFDPQKDKLQEFSPIIPDDPSLPDSEEKDLEPEKEDSATPSAPPEDLLDIILGKQEKLFADKPNKKTLSLKDIEEKEERRRKRQEKSEEELRRKQDRIKEAKMREKDSREQRKPQGDVNQIQPSAKRKSRFSDEVVQEPEKSAPIPMNFNLQQMPLLTKPPSPPRAQLPLPNPGLMMDPNLLSIIQNNVINQNIQQAIRQQQMNNEIFQIQAAHNLLAQMAQNPFLPPQPVLPQVLQPPTNFGISMPPPPPPDPIYNFNNSNGVSYMVPPPPPSSELPSTSNDMSHSSGITKKVKHEHVERVASVVKPFADKYGKYYHLSTADYKIMCKTIVKKVAKYNSPPKAERVEHLVKGYAQHLHNKSGKHKKS